MSVPTFIEGIFRLVVDSSCRHRYRISAQCIWGCLCAVSHAHAASAGRHPAGADKGTRLQVLPPGLRRWAARSEDVAEIPAAGFVDFSATVYEDQCDCSL